MSAWNSRAQPAMEALMRRALFRGIQRAQSQVRSGGRQESIAIWLTKHRGKQAFHLPEKAMVRVARGICGRRRQDYGRR